VTSTGLKYPLNNLTLHSWWRGTLNEAEGECFTLRFDTGKIIVFMEHPKGEQTNI
jgi:thiamine pyrophosphokinase